MRLQRHLMIAGAIVIECNGRLTVRAPHVGAMSNR
jgi:hypothetical protein